MKKIIFILIIIHCLLSIANAQWVLQSSGTEQTLNSVYFVDKHTGWTVGDSGTILTTINGGKKWKSLKHNSITANLNSVRFINEKTGWCVGDNGVILETKDKGKNWSYQYSGSSNAINSVFFVSSHIGWCVGNFGLVLKTSNAGTNWLTQTCYDDSYNSVYFINQNTGWICGTGERILKTTNGGVNWLTIETPEYRQWHSIFFINPLTGWVVGRIYAIEKSTDGGESWSDNSYSIKKESEKSPPGIYSSVFFINQNTGWYTVASSLRNGIVQTTDCGLSWFTALNTIRTALYSIYFVNPHTGWAVGEYGTIYKSTDNTNSPNTNIKEENILDNYSLSQNYPNPFNPITKIKFEVPLSKGGLKGVVSLKVFDITGKEVATLVNEQLQPGEYEVTFDGKNLPSGVYFYKLITNGFIETKKMLMIK